jgi:hypothetical protein
VFSDFIILFVIVFFKRVFNFGVDSPRARQAHLANPPLFFLPVSQQYPGRTLPQLRLCFLVHFVLGDGIADRRQRFLVVFILVWLAKRL